MATKRKRVELGDEDERPPRWQTKRQRLVASAPPKKNNASSMQTDAFNEAAQQLMMESKEQLVARCKAHSPKVPGNRKDHKSKIVLNLLKADFPREVASVQVNVAALHVDLKNFELVHRLCPNTSIAVMRSEAYEKLARPRLASISKHAAAMSGYDDDRQAGQSRSSSGEADPAYDQDNRAPVRRGGGGGGGGGGGDDDEDYGGDEDGACGEDEYSDADDELGAHGAWPGAGGECTAGRASGSSPDSAGGSASADSTSYSVYGHLESLGVALDACSQCTLKALARGVLRLDGPAPLQQLVAVGTCRECRQPIPITLLQALAQSDNDDGKGERGAARCANPQCFGAAVCVSFCSGAAEVAPPSFFRHCHACPNHGACMGDVRNLHCEACGQHYFSGLDCPCTQRGQAINPLAGAAAAAAANSEDCLVQ